jgi:hypothetical protein
MIDCFPRPFLNSGVRPENVPRPLERFWNAIRCNRPFDGDDRENRRGLRSVRKALGDDIEHKSATVAIDPVGLERYHIESGVSVSGSFRALTVKQYDQGND